MAFRLTSTNPLEADIQASIETALESLLMRKKLAWFARMNGGGAMVKGRAGRMRFLPFYRLFGFGVQKSKGIPDVIGQMADGRILAIEVKRVGEKLTPDQREFIDRVVENGGIAFVVYSVDDVFRVLS